MVGPIRAIGALVECLGAAILLAGCRTVGDGVRARPFAAGVAAGYLYRHARAVAGCRRFRNGPGRSLAVALAWAALGVAVQRSADDTAASRSFAGGLALGSAGYWLAVDGSESGPEPERF